MYLPGVPRAGKIRHNNNNATTRATWKAWGPIFQQLRALLSVIPAVLLAPAAAAAFLLLPLLLSVHPHHFFGNTSSSHTPSTSPPGCSSKRLVSPSWVGESRQDSGQQLAVSPPFCHPPVLCNRPQSVHSSLTLPKTPSSVPHRTAHPRLRASHHVRP